MRQIKIRAWDKYKKGFGYVTLHPTGNLSVPSIEIFDRSSYGSDHISFANIEPWEQFTGLHDKNGKEIYEGDIVNHEKYKHPRDISFYEGSFIWGKTYISNALVNFNVPKYFEVIGNIHENPELLERKAND